MCRRIVRIKDKLCDNDPVSMDEFVASAGWCDKFMKINGLSMRRRTTTSQKDPARMVNKIVAYILHVRRLTAKFKYEVENIISMDETTVWADMVCGTTVDKKGSKDIPLKTNGHEKVRVLVCLAAKADGTKLIHFVFAGAKRESKALNDEFKTRCVVTSSANGWMNEELTIDWVRNIFISTSFTAWDTYDAHLTWQTYY